MKIRVYTIILLTTACFSCGLFAQSNPPKTVTAKKLSEFKLRPGEIIQSIYNFGPAAGFLEDKWWAYTHDVQGNNTFVFNGKRLFSWKGASSEDSNSSTLVSPPLMMDGEVLAFYGGSYQSPYFYYKGRQYGPHKDSIFIRDQKNKIVGLVIVEQDNTLKWLYRGKFHSAPKNRGVNKKSLKPGPGGRLAYTFTDKQGTFAYLGSGRASGPYKNATLYGKGENIILSYEIMGKGPLRHYVVHRGKKLGPYALVKGVETSPNHKRIAFMYKRPQTREIYAYVDGKNYGPYSEIEYFRYPFQFTGDSRNFYFQFVKNNQAWLNINGREHGPYERQKLFENVFFTPKTNNVTISYGKNSAARKGRVSMKTMRQMSRHDDPFISGRVTSALDSEITHFLQVGKQLLRYTRGAYIYFSYGSKIIGKFKQSDSNWAGSWKPIIFPNGNYFFFIYKNKKPLISFKNKSTYSSPHLEAFYKQWPGDPYYIDYQNPRLLFLELNKQTIVLRRIIPPQ